MNRRITIETDVVGEVCDKKYSQNLNLLFLILELKYGRFKESFCVDLKTYDSYEAGDRITVKNVVVYYNENTEEYIEWSPNAGLESSPILIDTCLFPDHQKLVDRFELT